MRDREVMALDFTCIVYDWQVGYGQCPSNNGEAEGCTVWKKPGKGSKEGRYVDMAFTTAWVSRQSLLLHLQRWFSHGLDMS